MRAPSHTASSGRKPPCRQRRRSWLAPCAAVRMRRARASRACAAPSLRPSFILNTHLHCRLVRPGMPPMTDYEHRASCF